MDTAIEAKLGVGLVRNKEYIGLYLNLTVWSINATSNVIPLSLREGFYDKYAYDPTSQIISLNGGIPK